MRHEGRALLLVLLGLFTPAVGAAQQAEPAPLRKHARTGPAKIALLTSRNVDAARNVQDLALVKLSEDKGLIVLERATVERLLQEQKLSLAGLIDGNTAVQAGKILAVDLLAVIDHSSAAQQNTSAVIFDAGTGVRLEDVGFTSADLEQQAREIAAAVRRAVEKWRAGTKNLKTVCFLPVRNADLPRSMDAFCETLSAQLERQLLHHPAIVTLERKRLDGVTREKALTQEPATRALLTSVVQVELEIGHVPQSAGVRATVTIRDHAGKELKKIVHEVADPTGANLLGPLVGRVQRALDAVEVRTSAACEQESRRFVREAVLLWKHRHYEQALQAAEAAYALSASEEARLLLAEYLISSAWENWKPGILAAGRYEHQPFEVGPAKVNESLERVGRAYQLLDAGKAKMPGKVDHGGYWGLAENSACFYANIVFLREMQDLQVKPDDADTTEAIRAFRALSLRRHLERVRELAQRVGPKGIARLTRALNDQYIYQFFSFAPDVASAGKAVRESLRIWLDLSRQLPANAFPPDSARLFGASMLPALYRSEFRGKDYAPAERAQSLPLLKELEKHPYPVIRFYAVHMSIKQRLKLQSITPGEAEKRYRQLIEEAKDWIDRPPFKSMDPHRVACYLFLDRMLQSPPLTASGTEVPSTKAENYFALADFMLQRGDVVDEVWIHAAVETSFRRGEHAKGLQLVGRLLKDFDAPKHRLFYDPNKRLKAELERTRWHILKFAPNLDKNRPVIPWDKVIVLAKTAQIKNANVLMAPTRHGPHVYLLAGCFDPAQLDKPYLQLVRAHLDGGQPQLLGKAYATPKSYDPKQPQYAFNELPRFITETVIHRDHFYAGTVSRGIYVFPLSGGDGVSIGEKDGLPSSAVISLTALKDKLAVALEGGYLVLYDLETKQVDVIASSRRTQPLSPFDNAKPFQADNLLADGDRQRLLLRVYQESPQHPNTGMWQYSLKTRRFDKLLPIWYYRASRVQDGKFYLYGHTWIGQFDLATNKFTLLQGKSPPEMPAATPAGIPAQASFAIRFPSGGNSNRLYHDGSLWLASPFSRQPLQGGKAEILPHVGRKDWLNIHFNESLEAISRGELLIGDWRGLYLVRLKEQAPGKTE